MTVNKDEFTTLILCFVLGILIVLIIVLYQAQREQL